LSADKDQEYFSDGLAEEIINLLAQVPGLKVIARTSAFAFRGKEQDIREIASALGVRTLLQGSVRRAGSRMRIAVQLIDAGGDLRRVRTGWPSARSWSRCAAPSWLCSPPHGGRKARSPVADRRPRAEQASSSREAPPGGCLAE